MEQGNDGERLSQILTHWEDLGQVHGGMLPALDAARQRLLRRYSPAVYSYLIGAVRDADVADDLFQEFALRLMRGAFRRADPRRGRFRDFLKTALGHLVTDHYRRQLRGPRLYHDFPDRAFAALEAFEQRTGQPLHTLLHFRVEHPDLPVADMARQLSGRLGQEPSV